MCFEIYSEKGWWKRTLLDMVSRINQYVCVCVCVETTYRFQWCWILGGISLYIFGDQKPKRQDHKTQLLWLINMVRWRPDDPKEYFTRIWEWFLGELMYRPRGFGHTEIINSIQFWFNFSIYRCCAEGEIDIFCFNDQFCSIWILVIYWYF